MAASRPGSRPGAGSSSHRGRPRPSSRRGRWGSSATKGSPGSCTAWVCARSARSPSSRRPRSSPASAPAASARTGWPRGEEEHPPALTVPPPDLVEVCEIDPPAERVDEAAFAAKGLADRLLGRLEARGLACTQVVVEAETEHGEHVSRSWRHEGALTPAALTERVRWQLDGWITGGLGERVGRGREPHRRAHPVAAHARAGDPRARSSARLLGWRCRRSRSGRTRLRPGPGDARPGACGDPRAPGWPLARRAGGLGAVG